MSVRDALRTPAAHVGTALCLAGVGLVVAAGSVLSSLDTFTVQRAAQGGALLVAAYVVLLFGGCIHRAPTGA